MERLPSDDVLDALVDIFDPHDHNRYATDPSLPPGWRIDTHRTQGDPGGERVYSSEFLSDAVEGHSKPDELEIRRRQNELTSIDRTRRGRRA